MVSELVRLGFDACAQIEPGLRRPERYGLVLLVFVRAVFRKAMTRPWGDARSAVYFLLCLCFLLSDLCLFLWSKLRLHLLAFASIRLRNFEKPTFNQRSKIWALLEVCNALNVVGVVGNTPVMLRADDHANHC